MRVVLSLKESADESSSLRTESSSLSTLTGNSSYVSNITWTVDDRLEGRAKGEESARKGLSRATSMAVRLA